MKEAVVFIIDTNPSMKEPYPRRQEPQKSTTTRLDCAKQVVVSMIADLMLQSKTNEVSVIGCHTAATQHHRMAADEGDDTDDIPFSHLTELTPGIVRPTADLLRRIAHDVHCCNDDDDAHISRGGSVCDAILLAADAHHARAKHKFARKIVVLTDAAQNFHLKIDPMLHVIDALRDMHCSIQVIGFDFTVAAIYEEPATPNAPDDEARPPHKKKKIQREDDDQAPDDGASNNNDDMNTEDTIVYATKRDREQLLLSLTEKTGGAVIAVSTMQELLQANCGRRLQNSVQTKFALRIAPGLVVDARFYLLMSKQSFPKMITKAVIVADDADADRTVASAPIEKSGPSETFKVQSAQLFVDPDHPDDLVDDEDRTKAIQFGSTLIPMSSFDYEGLKPSTLGARLEILGYLDRHKIAPWHWAGPPSGITGHDSVRAGAAITALAQALHRTNKVAIGTFYKRSTSTKPRLVALFPDVESNAQGRLVVLQIPFAGETKRVDLDCFDSFLEEEDEEMQAIKSQTCDDLIQALRLPEHVLGSGTVPSPLLRACHQTKIQRAMDPTADLVQIRNGPMEHDPMGTPLALVQQAAPAWEAMKRVFQLDRGVESHGEGKSPLKKQASGRKVLTYKDYI